MQFRRQSPIGPFIVDFLCTEKKLIIELDGWSHVLREKQDIARDAYLEHFGYTVMRFSKAALYSLDQVLATIQEYLVPSTAKGEGQGVGLPDASNANCKPDILEFHE